MTLRMSRPIVYVTAAAALVAVLVIARPALYSTADPVEQASNQVTPAGPLPVVPVVDLDLDRLRATTGSLKESERDPFRFRPKPPPPAPRVQAPPPVVFTPPPVPTGPPPPPPIPLKFLGFVTMAGNSEWPRSATREAIRSTGKRETCSKVVTAYFVLDRIQSTWPTRRPRPTVNPDDRTMTHLHLRILRNAVTTFRQTVALVMVVTLRGRLRREPVLRPWADCCACRKLGRRSRTVPPGAPAGSGQHRVSHLARAGDAAVRPSRISIKRGSSKLAASSTTRCASIGGRANTIRPTGRWPGRWRSSSGACATRSRRRDVRDSRRRGRRRRAPVRRRRR